MEQQENEPHRMTNKELFERQKQMLLMFAEKGAISEAYCVNIPREIERLDRANCAL